MSNSKRREEKKRQHKKRLATLNKAKKSLGTILQTMQHLSGVSEPSTWPGAADPSLSRPDHIKFELGTFASKGPGRDLCRQLERQLQRGLLDFVPDMDHWGVEEFFWHGLPGNPWHPIDHFLRIQGDRFPAAAPRSWHAGKMRGSAATKSVRLPMTWLPCARRMDLRAGQWAIGSAPSHSTSAA